MYIIGLRLDVLSVLLRYVASDYHLKSPIFLGIILHTKQHTFNLGEIIKKYTAIRNVTALKKGFV